MAHSDNWAAVDFAVRTMTPYAFDAYVLLHDGSPALLPHSANLRALPKIVDSAAANIAHQIASNAYTAVDTEYITKRLRGLTIAYSTRIDLAALQAAQAAAERAATVSRIAVYAAAAPTNPFYAPPAIIGIADCTLTLFDVDLTFDVDSVAAVRSLIANVKLTNKTAVLQAAKDILHVGV